MDTYRKSTYVQLSQSGDSLLSAAILGNEIAEGEFETKMSDAIKLAVHCQRRKNNTDFVRFLKAAETVREDMIELGHTQERADATLRRVMRFLRVRSV